MLAGPQEFNEAMMMGGGAPEMPGGGFAPVALHVSPSAPRVNVIVPTGGGRSITVSVVNKRAKFHIPLDQLRIRCVDVAVRPNGRVLAYDGVGNLVGRFTDWNEAAGVFKQAAMLEPVVARMEEKRKHREAGEKAARDASSQKFIMAGGSAPDNGGLATAIAQLASVLDKQGKKPEKPEKEKAA